MNKDTEIKTLRERIAELEFTQKTMNKSLSLMDGDLARIKTKLGIGERVPID